MIMNITKKITTSGVLIAMSFVLVVASKLIPSLPNGGQITLASMVPVVTISFLLGTKWGLMSSLVYALLQMMTGFYPPPVQNFSSFLLVILLDYIFAFGVLGLSKFFAGFFRKSTLKYSLGAGITVFLRYICHILSGIIIWGVYAPEGQSVLAYSVLYNGSYMVPEIIITAVTCFIITPYIKKYNQKKENLNS